ncbi:MAG: TonB-dependent receptor [Chitinophagaceae bacterium]|nr:TonB-dependent receptor [Chitinophagaceae bacterium]
MKLIILISLLLSANSLLAQSAIIKGTVQSKGELIGFAHIELNTDAKQRRHTWSDSAGQYHFEVRQVQKYIIKASYMGYKDFVSDTIQIKEPDEQYVLNIQLEEKSTVLQGVTIISKKNVFETAKGKLIFNVQNSALTTGQTAFDILKNLPGVSIGQNDEILFRGSAGINVMIDGKMTYLSGNQLANYLKGMGAEDLNKIELITTPPVAFDAAGNSGIINIVPKKNLKQGYAVDIRSAVSKGKFWMNNQSIASSFRAKNWSVNGMFDFKTPHSYTENKSGNTINDGGNLLRLSRNNDWAYKVKYYTWRMGADWQFMPKHKIGVNYHGYFDDFKSYNHSTVGRLDNSNELHSFIRSANNIIEPYHYDAINLNYRYDIDSLGKKITADANYTSYRNFSDGLMTTGNYEANGDLLNENLLKSHQPGFVKIKSGQIDAELPYQKFTLKSGIKYAEVENDNQYSFDTLQAGNFVEVETMSNHFKYKERIAAAYLSGSKKWGKTSLEAGLRLEHTNADGYTVKQDVSNKWEYIKLFPSLAVEQVINDNNKIDFSMSRRINRPSYTELNPVRWYTDQYFYWSGNPNLVPELAWVYNVTYSLKSKYIFSAVYNQSLNYINRRLVMDDNGTTVRTQSDNFGTRHRFDFTVSAPVQLFSFWDAQIFSDISYTSYPISMLSGDKELSQWAAMLLLQQNFSLPKGFKINIAGFYYTPELRGIYLTQPAGWVDFGVKKSFFGNKLEAQFSINDILNTNCYRANSQTDIADYYYRDKPYSRVFGFSLRYHFGGELIKSSTKKTEEQQRL